MDETKTTCDYCNCDVCDKVRSDLEKIFRVLDIYGWLLDSYIVDFFLEDLWNKLPGEWQNTLDVVSPQELGKWILGEACERVWPLSLMALREVIRSLVINRNHNEGEAIKCKKRSSEGKSFNSLEELDSVNSNLYVNDSKFNNLFIKHVKTKKRYEIEKMSQILGDCALKANCKCVVDIGAGMGHLARVLAFKYGFSVTCVEQDPLLTAQAKKCDEQFLTSLRKYNPNCNGKLQHVSMTVNVNDSGEEVVNYLTKSFESEQTLITKRKELGLVGLHPCGDLATTLLRLYSNCAEAKFICIVGCCYMKLTRSGDKFALKGYPMSQYVSTLDNNEISFNALEVSCHAMEKHCDKLKEERFSDLIVHTYRAALEYMLVQKSSKLRRIQVNSVKVKNGMCFEQYCKAAVANLEPHKQPEDFYYTQPKIIQFLSEWNRVLVFGSLRLMLAPLVETCVLLDRFLFLSEKKLGPSLKAEFDCRVSPRNFVLISSK
ncbi:protein RRNAD1 [Belonocnema kinseyi]|uniref:protein RRNAD1 n=1 Tax=Belonocnema kinseyi TaxID=2817044 RepID=UPI00143D7391|nr:protein RRNAD1 [Belonocnema kinseyi]